jgi:hypothetical protein
MAEEMKKIGDLAVPITDIGEDKDGMKNTTGFVISMRIELAYRCLIWNQDA